MRKLLSETKKENIWRVNGEQSESGFNDDEELKNKAMDITHLLFTAFSVTQLC